MKFDLLGFQESNIFELWRPSLLAAVFEAQVNANMWRRNGLVVQNQVYYYRNVRCRSSMFDVDVICMQLAASLLPADDFLLMLIYSFGLSNWTRREYDSEITPDESMKQVVSLAESLFTWILVIFCERYVLGVGEVDYRDIVKYEVVHNLCIQPMAYSELTNSISDVIRQHDSERELEEMVKEVAVFRKPRSSLGKGLYELKEEHFKAYNPFYYHYSKVERTKSEENVRSHLKRQQESTCIHPPPHDLPRFNGIFSSIGELLHCDTFMHLIRLVLRRCSLKVSKSASENQLEKVLFLVRYALREEKRRTSIGLSYEFVNKCIQEPPQPGLPSVLQLMHCLQTAPSLQHSSIKELIASTYTDLKEMASLEVSDNPSHLFLRCSSAIPALQTSLRRSEKGKLKREKVMANMAKQQVRFIKENQALFESTSTEAKEDIARQSAHNDERMEDVVMTQPIALGVRRSAGVAGLSRQTCILCQEDQDISWSESALVYCSFMQKSSVLSTDRSVPLPPTNVSDADPLFTEACLPLGVYTSTCGHVMHASCWKLFFESLRQRELSRARMRMHQASFESAKKEFLCPLCDTICNCILPLIPSLASLNKESEDSKVDVTLDEWLEGILKTVENSLPHEADQSDGDDWLFLVPCPLSTVTKMMAEGVATRFHAIFDYMIEDNSSAFSESIVDMLKRFAQDIFERSMDVASDVNDDRVITTLWNTCSYSIMAIENMLRAEERALFGWLPSRQAECMGTLIRLAAISSGVFPDDVVKKRCIRLLSELTSCGRMRGVPKLDMFHCLVSLCLSLPTLYIPSHQSPAPSPVPSTPGGGTVGVNGGGVGGGGGSGVGVGGGGGGGGGGRNGIKMLATPSGRVNESNALKLVLAHHVMQIMLSIPDPRQVSEGRIAEDGVASGRIAEVEVGAGRIGEVEVGGGRIGEVEVGGGRIGEVEVGAGQIGEVEQPSNVLDQDMMDISSINTEWRTEHAMEVDEASEGDELLQLSNQFRRKVKLADVSMTANELTNHIKASALPFLRSACLFFHYLTSVPAPLKLFDNGNSEFELICEYLDLPSHLPSLFTSSPNLLAVLSNVCHNFDVENTDSSKQLKQQTSLNQQLKRSNKQHQQKSSQQRQSNQQISNLQQQQSNQQIINQQQQQSTQPQQPQQSTNEQQEESTQQVQQLISDEPQLEIFCPIKLTHLKRQRPSKKAFEPPSSSSAPPTSSSALPLIISFPRRPNTLLQLPKHYSQLINQFSMFTCPKFNSAEESRNPAMCLVCGCIVCSQSYCCQVRINSKVVGAAMAHSFWCGAGSGIFIRVRDCQVVMLNGMSRGCFISPPYLDQHRETDEGLRRGNPLYLCEERYAELERLWRSHSIPEHIVHKLELLPHFSASYDWQHF